MTSRDPHEATRPGPTTLHLPDARHLARVPAHVTPQQMERVRQAGYFLPQVVKPADYVPENQRQRELSFAALGALQARPGVAADDGCKASCIDWYGNARPIFLGDRVFALLGYEIVEGALSGRGAAERIGERRRISFAPGAASNGRYSPFG